MLVKFISFTAVSLAITTLIALGLILSERPKELSDADTDEGGLDFASIMALGHSEVRGQEGVEMDDGWDMPVRRYGDNDASKPLLILVHGSGWVGLQFDRLAKKLSEDAHVVVPDLRGHGANPERRGDVDYINQMQDDIAVLIEAVRLSGQSVILAGHSSGGGLVVRFAGSVHGDKIDQAILLAPFLKHNAPTTRQSSGGWARVMIRRIIGLSILNTFKITMLNHLTIIQFNMPKAARTGEYGQLATLAYSYRLNTGYAPRADYLKDVAALPKFTLIVGSNDEAFFADKYEEVMSAVTDNGSYHIVVGEAHLSIIDAPTTAKLIKETLK